MAKIRILPEQLANQIAAGEVVERPASVVKELLENCLDAGANRIEVEIEGGGTRLIRVIDNGSGMDEDDLLLCLERHGTSKLATVEDLAAIATLGFRGEAIPSIGSVSQLTITSRPSDKQLGTRVVLHYGKLLKAHEIGCSYGTTCEIRDLFGNTPARRKFLRTVRTELGHIEEVVKNYSLCAPNATFILRLDGREAISLDKTQSIEQRLRLIMRYTGPFVSIGVGSQKEKSRQITGLLIPPEKVTVGPAGLRVFVNGRAIRDRMIIHAVTEGMRSFLMKGKNPAGMLHLLIPPTEVDVNVHPAKHEVRFHNAKEIHELIRETVAKAMLDQQSSMKMSIFSVHQSVQQTTIPSDVTLLDETPSPQGYATRPRTEPHDEPIHPSPSFAPIARTAIIDIPPQRFSLLATAEPLPKSGTQKDVPLPHEVSAGNDRRSATHNLQVIGQYDNLYIFCRSSEGLVVIDQHAAHERLLFEKLRRQYQAATIVRQNLMFPVTIELSLFQTQLLEKNTEEIDRMGFSIRDFGGHTFIISAIPALAGTTSPRDLFLDVLERFGSEGGTSEQRGCLDAVLATMACKAAVKAGTALNSLEIDTLLNEMAKADLFSHCPHGRPVIKQFSRDEINRWFYRT
jgi:DNA mismatch repair protein MutL